MPYHPKTDDIEAVGLEKELTFKTSRAGGKGGQHVNKVETKVELSFKVGTSEVLSIAQKYRLRKILGNRINKEDVLTLSTAAARSQQANKKIIIKRFYKLLEKALKPQKKRIPVKLPKAVKEKRLRAKRLQSQKKRDRRASFDKD